MVGAAQNLSIRGQLCDAGPDRVRLGKNIMVNFGDIIHVDVTEVPSTDRSRHTNSLYAGRVKD